MLFGGENVLPKSHRLPSKNPMREFFSSYQPRDSRRLPKSYRLLPLPLVTSQKLNIRLYC